MKKIWVKHKRIILIVFAALFLFALFLIKDTSLFENTISFVQGNQENGLTYDNATIADLVSKDTDGDGIVDWEEPLYGLDPTKKETTPGIPDSVALSKLQATQGNSAGTINGGNVSAEPEKLTETEKFSRELFATVAAGSQNGAMDQTTIDVLGSSLAEKIQNPVVRKIFSASDLNGIKDDSVQEMKNYFNTMSKIEAKYPIDVVSILQKFTTDNNDINISALAELDLIIKPLQGILDEVTKTNAPQSLAPLHLDFLNKLEKVIENLNDIKLFDTDPIVAMGAISQIEQNATSLESAVTKLINAVSQKLKNE